MDEKTMCIIMLILACILILVYLLYRIKKDGLKQTTIELIVYAEGLYKKGENRAKMNYVVDKLLLFLPLPVRFFITSEAIENFIQSVFDQVKVALDYKGGQD